MANKRPKPDETISQFRRIEVLIGLLSGAARQTCHSLRTELPTLL